MVGEFLKLLFSCLVADVTEEISSKVTAGANYLGSIFSSAWSKTAKTANEATSGSSAFLSSALTKVTGSKYHSIIHEPSS